MPEPTSALMRLVVDTQLEDLSFTHLSATRVAHEGGAEEQSDEVVNPVFGLRLETKDELEADGSQGFRIFLRCDVTLEKGPVSAEVMAAYRTGRAAAPLVRDQDVVLEYVNEVAIMACLPYLRQALADMTQRVFRYPLLMPVMARGAVRFGADSAREGQ